MCYKCNKKGHVARNCTAKVYRVQGDIDLEGTNVFRGQEGTEKIKLSEEAEVNGQPVKRIQLDSGASRTMVDSSLVSPADIGEESMIVTFGYGASGEYPLAPVRVNGTLWLYCRSGNFRW